MWRRGGQLFFIAKLAKNVAGVVDCVSLGGALFVFKAVNWTL